MDLRRTRLTIALYATLAAAALLWMTLRGDASYVAGPAFLTLPRGARLGISLGLGLMLASVTVATTRYFVTRTRWARALHMEFRNLLGPLSGQEILLYAAASGIAEELFFRGALQPSVGVLIASAIFGLVHVPSQPALRPWSLWAGIMGVLFGGIYWLTGELAGPMVAHALINAVNLRFIRDHRFAKEFPVESPAPAPIPPSTLPRLVVQRSRVGGR